MSLVSDEYGLYASRFIDWLRRARLLLAVAVVVFGALWALGFIALGPALAGFVLISAAALAMRSERCSSWTL